MDIIQFLKESGAAALPALWVIGATLKGIPAFPNWAIPLAVIPCGIVATCMMNGASVDAVLQGILAGAAAVGLHQATKLNK